MRYINFVEKYLGEVEKGIGSLKLKKGTIINVVKYKESILDATITYSTFGLSNVGLKVKNKYTTVGFEFYSLIDVSVDEESIKNVYKKTLEDVLNRGEIYQRGEVITFDEPIFDTEDKYCLYVANPVYFPEGFDYYLGEDGEIVNIWLIPITTEEANYIREYGWSKFEDLLEDKDPDLIDFNRVSIV